MKLYYAAEYEIFSMEKDDSMYPKHLGEIFSPGFKTEEEAEDWLFRNYHYSWNQGGDLWGNKYKSKAEEYLPGGVKFGKTKELNPCKSCIYLSSAMGGFCAVNPHLVNKGCKERDITEEARVQMEEDRRRDLKAEFEKELKRRILRLENISYLKGLEASTKSFLISNYTMAKALHKAGVIEIEKI